jgi:acyl-CoA synthetase (AMP-forming)/AMP-acid ligase II
MSRIGYEPGRTARNNVIAYVEDHLLKFPDRPALVWAKPGAVGPWSAQAAPQAPVPHENLSYGELAQRIRVFAQGLLDLGLRAGDRVILFLPMSLDMYTAMFAVQRIGAIAVFLDSWARSHHLGASAECVDPAAMISSKPAFDLVAQVPEFAKMPHRILWGPGEIPGSVPFARLLNAKGEAPIAPVESETTALITFTTGSSGKPKGANRTHRFLSAQHEALDKVIPYTPADRDLPAFPIFSLNNLAAGVTTVLPALDLARPAAHDSALLVSQIVHERVTCTTLSPSMFVGVARCCQEQGLQLDKLRRAVTGGAPISKDDVRAFAAIAPNAEIWILYGSTEVEPMAHIEGREMLAADRTGGDDELLEEGVNVGHISEDLEYKFIRIEREVVRLGAEGWKAWEQPQGQVGEFIVTGDHVCRDYYNNPEAFDRAKIRDAQGRVWHRTGDLGYEDAEGFLWIVGRIHNVIEREGRYYFPVRAEVLLKRHPHVAQAAFLGLPDKRRGEKTVAVVTLKSEAARERVREDIERVFVKNRIPVDEILTVEKIPMDPRHHSKVEYGVLKEELANGAGRRL